MCVNVFSLFIELDEWTNSLPFSVVEPPTTQLWVPQLHMQPLLSEPASSCSPAKAEVCLLPTCLRKWSSSVSLGLPGPRHLPDSYTDCVGEDSFHFISRVVDQLLSPDHLACWRWFIVCCCSLSPRAQTFS